MASLVKTFSDVYTSVSEFLGLGSSPTGADLTKVKEYTYRGYLKLLTARHPINPVMHNWSFLKQRTKIITVSGQYQYLLPENFWRVEGPLNHSVGTGYDPLTKVDEKTITFKRNFSDCTSYPLNYCVVDGEYTVQSGQRKEMWFYPTPGSNYSIELPYIMMPPKPTEDDHYFVGGPEVSECIRLCALAVAELEEDEMASAMNNLANTSLTNLMIADSAENCPDTLGPMTGGLATEVDFLNRDRLRAIQEITEVYGVTI